MAEEVKVLPGEWLGSSNQPNLVLPKQTYASDEDKRVSMARSDYIALYLTTSAPLPKMTLKRFDEYAKGGKDVECTHIPLREIVRRQKDKPIEPVYAVDGLYRVDGTFGDLSDFRSHIDDMNPGTGLQNAYLDMSKLKAGEGWACFGPMYVESRLEAPTSLEDVLMDRIILADPTGKRVSPAAAAVLSYSSEPVDTKGRKRLQWQFPPQESFIDAKDKRYAEYLNAINENMMPLVGGSTSCTPAILPICDPPKNGNGRRPYAGGAVHDVYTHTNGLPRKLVAQVIAWASSETCALPAEMHEVKTAQGTAYMMRSAGLAFNPKYGTRAARELGAQIGSSYVYKHIMGKSDISVAVMLRDEVGVPVYKRGSTYHVDYQEYLVRAIAGFCIIINDDPDAFDPNDNSSDGVDETTEIFRVPGDERNRFLVPTGALRAASGDDIKQLAPEVAMPTFGYFPKSAVKTWSDEQKLRWVADAPGDYAVFDMLCFNRGIVIPTGKGLLPGRENDTVSIATPPGESAKHVFLLAAVMAQQGACSVFNGGLGWGALEQPVQPKKMLFTEAVEYDDIAQEERQAYVAKELPTLKKEKGESPADYNKRKLEARNKLIRTAVLGRASLGDTGGPLALYSAPGLVGKYQRQGFIAVSHCFEHDGAWFSIPYGDGSDYYHTSKRSRSPKMTFELVRAVAVGRYDKKGVYAGAPPVGALTKKGLWDVAPGVMSTTMVGVLPTIGSGEIGGFEMRSIMENKDKRSKLFSIPVSYLGAPSMFNQLRPTRAEVEEEVGSGSEEDEEKAGLSSDDDETESDDDETESDDNEETESDDETENRATPPQETALEPLDLLDEDTDATDVDEKHNSDGEDGTGQMTPRLGVPRDAELDLFMDGDNIVTRRDRFDNEAAGLEDEVRRAPNGGFKRMQEQAEEDADTASAMMRLMFRGRDAAQLLLMRNAAGYLASQKAYGGPGKPGVLPARRCDADLIAAVTKDNPDAADYLANRLDPFADTDLLLDRRGLSLPGWTMQKGADVTMELGFMRHAMLQNIRDARAAAWFFKSMDTPPPGAMLPRGAVDCIFVYYTNPESLRNAISAVLMWWSTIGPVGGLLSIRPVRRGGPETDLSVWNKDQKLVYPVSQIFMVKTVYVYLHPSIDTKEATYQEVQNGAVALAIAADNRQVRQVDTHEYYELSADRSMVYKLSGRVQEEGPGIGSVPVLSSHLRANDREDPFDEKLDSLDPTDPYGALSTVMASRWFKMSFVEISRNGMSLTYQPSAQAALQSAFLHTGLSEIDPLGFGDFLTENNMDLDPDTVELVKEITSLTDDLDVKQKRILKENISDIAREAPRQAVAGKVQLPTLVAKLNPDQVYMAHSGVREHNPFAPLVVEYNKGLADSLTHLGERAALAQWMDTQEYAKHELPAITPAQIREDKSAFASIEDVHQAALDWHAEHGRNPLRDPRATARLLNAGSTQVNQFMGAWFKTMHKTMQTKGIELKHAASVPVGALVSQLGEKARANLAKVLDDTSAGFVKHMIRQTVVAKAAPKKQSMGMHARYPAKQDAALAAMELMRYAGKRATLMEVQQYLALRGQKIKRHGLLGWLRSWSGNRELKHEHLTVNALRDYLMAEDPSELDRVLQGNPEIVFYLISVWTYSLYSSSRIGTFTRMEDAPERMAELLGYAKPKVAAPFVADAVRLRTLHIAEGIRESDPAALMALAERFASSYYRFLEEPQARARWSHVFSDMPNVSHGDFQQMAAMCPDSAQDSVLNLLEAPHGDGPKRTHLGDTFRFYAEYIEGMRSLTVQSLDAAYARAKPLPKDYYVGASKGQHFAAEQAARVLAVYMMDRFLPLLDKYRGALDLAFKRQGYKPMDASVLRDYAASEMLPTVRRVEHRVRLPLEQRRLWVVEAVLSPWSMKDRWKIVWCLMDPHSWFSRALDAASRGAKKSSLKDLTKMVRIATQLLLDDVLHLPTRNSSCLLNASAGKSELNNVLFDSGENADRQDATQINKILTVLSRVYASAGEPGKPRGLVDFVNRIKRKTALWLAALGLLPGLSLYAEVARHAYWGTKPEHRAMIPGKPDSKVYETYLAESGKLDLSVKQDIVSLIPETIIRTWLVNRMDSWNEVAQGDLLGPYNKANPSATHQALQTEFPEWRMQESLRQAKPSTVRKYFSAMGMAELLEAGVPRALELFASHVRINWGSKNKRWGHKEFVRDVVNTISPATQAQVVAHCFVTERWEPGAVHALDALRMNPAPASARSVMDRVRQWAPKLGRQYVQQPKMGYRVQPFGAPVKGIKYDKRNLIPVDYRGALAVRKATFVSHIRRKGTLVFATMYGREAENVDGPVSQSPKWQIIMIPLRVEEASMDVIRTDGGGIFRWYEAGQNPNRDMPAILYNRPGYFPLQPDARMPADVIGTTPGYFTYVAFGPLSMSGYIQPELVEETDKPAGTPIVQIDFINQLFDSAQLQKAPVRPLEEAKPDSASDESDPDSENDDTEPESEPESKSASDTEDNDSDLESASDPGSPTPPDSDDDNTDVDEQSDAEVKEEEPQGATEDSQRTVPIALPVAPVSSVPPAPAIPDAPSVPPVQPDASSDLEKLPGGRPEKQPGRGDLLASIRAFKRDDKSKGDVAAPAAPAAPPAPPAAPAAPAVVPAAQGPGANQGLLEAIRRGRALRKVIKEKVDEEKKSSEHASMQESLRRMTANMAKKDTRSKLDMLLEKSKKVKMNVVQIADATKDMQRGEAIAARKALFEANGIEYEGPGLTDRVMQNLVRQYKEDEKERIREARIAMKLQEQKDGTAEKRAREKQRQVDRENDLIRRVTDLFKVETSGDQDALAAYKKRNFPGMTDAQIDAQKQEAQRIERRRAVEGDDDESDSDDDSDYDFDGGRYEPLGAHARRFPHGLKHDKDVSNNEYTRLLHKRLDAVRLLLAESVYKGSPNDVDRAAREAYRMLSATTLSAVQSSGVDSQFAFQERKRALAAMVQQTASVSYDQIKDAFERGWAQENPGIDDKDVEDFKRRAALTYYAQAILQGFERTIQPLVLLELAGAKGYLASPALLDKLTSLVSSKTTIPQATEPEKGKYGGLMYDMPPVRGKALGAKSKITVEASKRARRSTPTVDPSDELAMVSLKMRLYTASRDLSKTRQRVRLEAFTSLQAADVVYDALLKPYATSSVNMARVIGTRWARLLDRSVQRDMAQIYMKISTYDELGADAYDAMLSQINELQRVVYMVAVLKWANEQKLRTWAKVSDGVKGTDAARYFPKSLERKLQRTLGARAGKTDTIADMLGSWTHFGKHDRDYFATLVGTPGRSKSYDMHQEALYGLRLRRAEMQAVGGRHTGTHLDTLPLDRRFARRVRRARRAAKRGLLGCHAAKVHRDDLFSDSSGDEYSSSDDESLGGRVRHIMRAHDPQTTEETGRLANYLGESARMESLRELAKAMHTM